MDFYLFLFFLLIWNDVRVLLAFIAFLGVWILCLVFFCIVFYLFS
jgi:hypothetical protein